jgi:AcrR family transcriptional regulator
MSIREEQKSATRTRILDAAAVLIAARGVDAASIDAIAKEAGVTSGAVYASFRNKAELMLAVARERTVPLPEGPVAEVAPAAAQAVDDFAAANPMDAGLLLQLLAAAARDDELKQALAERCEHGLSELEARMADAPLRGLSAGDAAALAQVVTAGLLALRPVMGEDFAQGVAGQLFQLLLETD